MTDLLNKIVNHRRLRKYVARSRKDLAEVYSRDLDKWLVVAPVIGVTVGLVTTAITYIILGRLWPPLLGALLHHPWTIIPVLTGGLLVTGLIMQFFTPDPNEHSTEEIIHSYHERQGRIDMRPFVPKLLAAVTTVGLGGSAALEGPSIYAGGAIGSWLWNKFRHFGFEPRDRRIMLISGAAAGMGAVFRAPLTGLVFALEMPYKDDLAHEALMPSLIASVISYVTLISFVGSATLFRFPAGAHSFSRADLTWSALLGAICGLIALLFDLTFRRFRSFVARLSVPHWTKLAAGGFLTGVCGLIFISLYPGSLIPLGPNYEAVGNILSRQHSAASLVVFALLKLLATLFTLGTGGVSAMFVPLFLTGDALGKAFALCIFHFSSADLFAAVGMAAFIAGGYKTPLTAVVFVAEATGGHSYIIPTIIGAAVAYAISGEASASGEQHLQERPVIEGLKRILARDIMLRAPVTVSESATVQELFDGPTARHHHSIFPVVAGPAAMGTISLWSVREVGIADRPKRRLAEFVDRDAARVAPDCDAGELLRILTSRGRRPMILVTDGSGRLEGVITRADILTALAQLAIAVQLEESGAPAPSTSPTTLES